MEKFWGLFDDGINYPSSNILAEEGVRRNTYYNYIANSYLDGLVNYIHIFKAVVIERYECFGSGIEEAIEEYKSSHHSQLGIFGNDVLLFGETENSYWFLWYDCDVSDCGIGRIDKDRVKNKNEMFELWKEQFNAQFESKEKPSEFLEVITGHFIEIDPPSGWVKW